LGQESSTLKGGTGEESLEAKVHVHGSEFKRGKRESKGGERSQQSPKGFIDLRGGER